MLDEISQFLFNQNSIAGWEISKLDARDRFADRDFLYLSFTARISLEIRRSAGRAKRKIRMKIPAPKIPSSRISGAQVRAARAMVGWTARALAKKAIVPDLTLEWIEGNGKITGADLKALAEIKATLEAAGILNSPTATRPGCGYIRKSGGGSEPQYQEGTSCGKSR
jgi:hypothetical protein